MLPMGPRNSGPLTEAAKLAQRKAQDAARAQDRMDLPRARGPAPKVLGGPPPVSPPMTMPGRTGPAPKPGMPIKPGMPMTGIANTGPGNGAPTSSSTYDPRRNPGYIPDPVNPDYKPGYMAKGGKIKGYAKGGSVSSASKRADGIAMKGKTKGRFV